MIRESCSVYERYENTPGNNARKLFYYPQWAGHFRCHPDFLIERKGYHSILLLATQKGCGTLHYRGTTATLTKGSFALINCRDQHTYYPASDEPWEFDFLHFSGKNSAELYEYLYSSAHKAVFADNSTITEMLCKLIQLCKQGPAANEVILSRLISDLFYTILLQDRQPAAGQFDSILRYIERNCAADLTASSLAAEFGFSRSYFSTSFKAATGTTISEYIMRCRLNKAKTLLLQNQLSIADIAEQTGFHESGTFIRAFKRREGISPLQYKKQIV